MTFYFLFCNKNRPFPASFSWFSSFHYSWQKVNKCSIKNSPMTAFEPRIIWTTIAHCLRPLKVLFSMDIVAKALQFFFWQRLSFDLNWRQNSQGNFGINFVPLLFDRWINVASRMILEMLGRDGWMMWLPTSTTTTKKPTPTDRFWRIWFIR